MNRMARAQVIYLSLDQSSWVTCDFVLGSRLNVNIVAILLAWKEPPILKLVGKKSFFLYWGKKYYG